VVVVWTEVAENEEAVAETGKAAATEDVTAALAAAMAGKARLEAEWT
jgi:hypothetical protein